VISEVHVETHSGRESQCNASTHEKPPTASRREKSFHLYRSAAEHGLAGPAWSPTRRPGTGLSLRTRSRRPAKRPARLEHQISRSTRFSNPAVREFSLFGEGPPLFVKRVASGVGGGSQVAIQLHQYLGAEGIMSYAERLSLSPKSDYKASSTKWRKIAVSTDLPAGALELVRLQVREASLRKR